MLEGDYQPQEFISIVETLFRQKYTGILTLKTDVSKWNEQKKCTFIFQDGQVVFANNKMLEREQFCQVLGNKINPNTINAALLVTKQRTSNSKSYREFVDLLVKMKVFTWEDVIKFVFQKIIQNLEIFSAYPGTSQLKTGTNFDLFSNGIPDVLSWSNLKRKIERRQQQWQSLKSAIPSMDVIPIKDSNRLAKISDPKVKQHITKIVDGQNNLLDIAQKMQKDPLSIANTYFNWYVEGWVDFKKPRTKNKDLPIVLSVDDSPIVQTTITRALAEICDIHLADRAKTALEILDRLPVKILLLDLTMPDLDGLEFCQKIRKIPKFKTLPIVMLTARDGLMNRAKGHLAGTNKYLTKPFKPEELREIVRQYIN